MPAVFQGLSLLVVGDWLWMSCDKVLLLHELVRSEQARTGTVTDRFCRGMGQAPFSGNQEEPLA